MKKKAIALPFNWIFAIIAGGIILFLAIYATTKFIGTGEKAISTETSAQLISLLDPFETGLASGKSAQVNFKKQSRVYLDCSSLENYPFGKQTIAFADKTIGDKFSEIGGDVPVYNKYIFAEEITEGKTLQVFSKPFFMPFKVADLIVITAENYCFYQAPNDVKKQIEMLGLDNIIFSDDLNNCTGTRVCFGGGGDCDTNVFGDGFTYDSGKVIKGNDELYYSNDLIYAAIFSSSEIYECNIQRLMNKFVELSDIYLDKISIIQIKGCSSNIEPNLRVMMDSAKALESSQEISILADLADIIDSVNQATISSCRLY